MTTAPAVSVVGVTHRYTRGAPPALSNVSLEIRPGERVGLLGPNGAGKSTLLRLLCAFLPLQEGKIRVAGACVAEDSLSARSRTGYLPETAPLPPELRVVEYLRFRARLKGIARLGAEVDRVLRATGTRAVARTPIGHLSRGYRQRVGIADALLGDPPVLVLDEPTAGLDPLQVEDVRALLSDLPPRTAVLFSTHLLHEVEAVCHRAVVLARGRVVDDQPVVGGARVHVVFGADPTPVLAGLERQGVAPERGPTPGPGNRVEVVFAAPAGGCADLCEQVGRRSLAAGIPVLELAPRRTPLAERFAAVVAGEGGDRAP